MPAGSAVLNIISSQEERKGKKHNPGCSFHSSASHNFIQNRDRQLIQNTLCSLSLRKCRGNDRISSEGQTGCGRNPLSLRRDFGEVSKQAASDGLAFTSETLLRSWGYQTPAVGTTG